MVRSGTADVLSTPDRQAVQAFLATARPDGCARLSGALPNLGKATEAAAAHDSSIVGYARAVEASTGYIVDCAADDPAIREQLVGSLIAGLPDGVAVTWWAHENPSDSALATSLSMQPPHRRLLNMSRPLPFEPTSAMIDQEVSVRPFVVGRDEAAWLQVNNAAFSWHGEQGDWDLATLRARMSEPWCDHMGFLLHERDSRLAAFCWTKVHQPDSAGTEVTGEIFVIAVHPDFHGLGLGRALTVAGLRHLNLTGATRARLYVESDNVAAVRLYESLGFRTTHTDIAFYRPALYRPASYRPAFQRLAFQRPASQRQGTGDEK